MKKLGLVLIVVSMLACFSFANPFVEAGGDSWSVLEGDLDAVTTAVSGMQPTITGAIVAILPMLIGIFVVFLVIKLAPRLIKSFAK